MEWKKDPSAPYTPRSVSTLVLDQPCAPGSLLDNHCFISVGTSQPAHSPDVELRLSELK